MWRYLRRTTIVPFYNWFTGMAKGDYNYIRTFCRGQEVTRDKEYNMTLGTMVHEFSISVNPNGEAEVLRITFKPRPKLKKLIDEVNMAELAIKGRASKGNLVSKNEIHKSPSRRKACRPLADENMVR